MIASDTVSANGGCYWVEIRGKSFAEVFFKRLNPECKARIAFIGTPEECFQYIDDVRTLSERWENKRYDET